MTPLRTRSPSPPSSRTASIAAARSRVSAPIRVQQFDRQLLVGEIDQRFEIGRQRHQRGTPGLDGTVERAVSLAPGLKALAVRLGVDQIGKRLGTEEVDLAVGEHPLREFAGSGRPKPLKRPELRQNGGGNGHRAVCMDFENILTGARARPPHGQKERLVKRGAVRSRSRARANRPGAGASAAKCRRNIKCPRPLIRITATADRPGGVACAKMVSAESRMALSFPSKLI